MTENQQPKLISSETLQPSPEELAKRDSARLRLAELLKDPQFRAIEGFPIGSDEDILALSDPPYYTACPNPFLPEIIAEWQQERETLRRMLKLSDERYQREPFAADVSEGKNDPIYNAHSYHTKVPHKAIMRYILHYTDPGDIVFDGFCGTGMTGVAAQLCGNKKAVEELGYRVDDMGVIWDGGKAISRLGVRKTVLNDLSPAATFIAYNYNTPVDTIAFEREAKRILSEVKQECGWMYETWHPHCDDLKRVKGIITETVWSDVFICPQCGEELIFWDAAVNQELGQIKDDWICSKCKTLLSKNPSKNSGAVKVERSKQYSINLSDGKTIAKSKQKPVLIEYEVSGKKYSKSPDTSDFEVMERVTLSTLGYWFPINRIDGDIDIWYERDYRSLGVYSVDAFFTFRNLLVLASLWQRAQSMTDKILANAMKYALTGMQVNLSRMNRWRANVSFPYNPLSGTLYISALQVESNVIIGVSNKVKRLLKMFVSNNVSNNLSLVSTQSTIENELRAPDNSVDYIFTDPPFGSNIIYSDLSIIWESWLKLMTSTKEEAVVHRRKKEHPTTLAGYLELMAFAFKEMNRLLKPGHWITIEFHNTQNSVWNAIQEAILRAGFMIADVRTLDKQQGSFKQVTTTSAVSQDLIISAYKPNGNLEEQFHLSAGYEKGAWDFIRYHLGKLPPVNIHAGQIIVNAERQAFLLFDRMVAFHIQRGVMVPISAPEFYAGLQQRFTPRDGMFFLPDQVTEYDRAVIDSKGVVQLSLFVTEEKSAIQWLRQQLDPNTGGQAQTHADLNPKFKLVLHQAKHEKAPELIEILEQNFLQDEEGKWYLPDHNKASDLERVRQRSLLREFGEYASGTGRIRQFRTEAVRAGFADCFRRQDYGGIIKVAERLPDDVLREDPDLLMYFDSATLRRK